jgi:hypothetical protein
MGMRDMLIEAGYALAEALCDPEEWPTDLRESANRMIDGLRARGSIPSTVEAMDSHTVSQLAMDIKILAADVETARIKGLVRSIAEQAALPWATGDWCDYTE